MTNAPTMSAKGMASSRVSMAQAYGPRGRSGSVGWRGGARRGYRPCAPGGTLAVARCPSTFASFGSAGYRGFRDARLPLDDVTFLVGRNGCGKSTLLDALDFVRDALTVSLGIALERRGGIHGVRHRLAGAGEAVEVAVVLELAVKVTEPRTSVAVPEITSPRRATTRGAWSTASRSTSRARCAGRCAAGRVTSCPASSGARGASPPSAGGASPSQPRHRKTRCSCRCSAASGSRARGARSAGRGAGSARAGAWSTAPWRLSAALHPNADAIREGSEIALGASLELDARNLANVLWQIRERAKESEPPRFAEMLNVIVPGLREVRTINHGTRRTLEFVCEWEGRGALPRERHVARDPARPRDARRAAQPSEPAVVSIDEVENSLHLGALR